MLPAIRRQAIDGHHIQPRAVGGTHDAPNQVGLWTVRHRAVQASSTLDAAGLLRKARERPG